jgi:hypothetical protein
LAVFSSWGWGVGAKRDVSMTSNSNVFVRIAAHNTPHHTDPANAVEFYAALGMLTVAWGRLEGHVIGNLLTIMSLLGTVPRKPLPLRWDDRLDLWKKGFSLPALEPHGDRAVPFMRSIIEAAGDRNYAAHTAWDEFVPVAAEPTIDARSIKAKKGVPNEVEVIDVRVTLSMIKRALADCNRLNSEMTEFTRLLSSLRPPPADALHF